MSELILIIGPCGSGKTTYARAHYPNHYHPDMEILAKTLFASSEQFRYYPVIRSCGDILKEQAVKHLLAKKQPICLTIGGATRKERMRWSDMAFDAGVDVHCIRLLVNAETCIARAKADKLRPATSKQHWQEIVEHWFRDFESVDCFEERIASYREIENG